MKNKLIPLFGALSLILGSPVCAPLPALATVSNQTTQTVTGYGDGSNVNFTITFDFRDNSWIGVTEYDTSTSPPTSTNIPQGSGAGKFSITGGNPGTTVVMGTAPTTTQYLTIFRNVPLTQNVVFNPASIFPYKGLSAQVDQMVLGMQNLASGVSTITYLPDLASAPALNYVGTVTTGTWNASTIGVPYGGTGQVSFIAGRPLIGNGASSISQGTLSGNTTEFMTASGTLTNGDLGAFDSNGNLVDSGITESSVVPTTFAAFGSSPNANGGSVTANAITLQPASASYPGGVSTGTQTFAGAKTFSGGVTAAVTGTASGNTTYTPTNHGVVVSGAANAMTVIAPGTASMPVISAGSGGDPVVQALDLSGPGVVKTLPNSNTTATNANTASTIVARDASGNFSAGTISAALTGTASGNTTYSANNHGVVLSGSGNAMSVAAPGVASMPFISGGASADGSYQALNLAGVGVLGTLPVGLGGSGQTSYTDGQLMIGNTTNNTLTKATITAGTGISVTNGHGSITVAATGALSNPMTTTGDIIYSSDNSGTPARLGIGGAGTALVPSAGIPAWASMPKATYWQTYTPTVTGMGSVTSLRGVWRQVGSDYEVMISFTAGTTTAALASVTLPNSATIDPNGLTITNNTTSGQGTMIGTIASQGSGSTGGWGYALTAPGTSTTLVYFSANPQALTTSLTPQNGSTIVTTGDGVAIRFSVPVTQGIPGAN